MTDDTRPTSAPTGVLRWAAATHPGRVRMENEDSFAAGPNLFLVADGMGGHAAGEVASAIAVSVLGERLRDGAATVSVAVAATLEANAAIFHAAHTVAGQQGMGTTITALVAVPQTDNHPPRLAALNVGDSRTYLVRDDEMHRVSVDHSYVQELVATGHISEAEARTHPRRNIITRALGIEPSVRVDSWILPQVRGDRFVLCSDGLVDEVDDETIVTIVADHPDPQECADALVAAANDAGGRDNITVVILDVMDGFAPDEAPGQTIELDDPWDEDTSLIDAERHVTEPLPITTPATPGTGPKRVSSRLGKRVAMVIGGLAVVGASAVAVIALTGDDPAPPTPSTTTTSTSTTTSISSSTTSTTTSTRPSSSLNPAVIARTPSAGSR